MKKYSAAIIAPAFIAGIVAVIFCCYELFPFGKLTLSWCDMNQQVVPFLIQFKDILAGKTDFFLSMVNAGGMNFLGVFFFFIASPFTFLVAFVDKADMMFFANILVLMKMMVCGITASLYFQRIFKRISTVQNVTLSVMYAFCGYTMLFYQNVVWLDMMYLFPLLLIALDKLILEKKAGLYIFILASMLTVNYYLSYMVVVFLVISMGMFIFYCMEKEAQGQCILRLGISTLVSGLLTGVIWVPALMQYLTSGRTQGLIDSLSSGNFYTSFYTVLPFLFCSAVLFCSFWLLPKLKLLTDKKIQFTLALFVLLIIPVFIEPINKIWHTGSYQAFPVRYGYMTVLIGLTLIAAVLQHLNGRRDNVTKSTLTSKILAFLITGVAAGVVIYFLLNYEEVLDAYTTSLWGTKDSFWALFIVFIFLLVTYVLLFALYKNNLLSKRLFTGVFCTVMVIECIFNGGVYIGTAANSQTHFRTVMNLEDKIQDDSFYRVKNEEKYFDVNLLGSIGYNNLNHYTSLTNEDYMFAMKKLGYSSYWMEVNSNGGTNLTDAFFSNKYNILQNMDVTTEEDLIYHNRNYSIVKKEQTLPLGVIISNVNVDAIEFLPDNKTRTELQEYLFRTICFDYNQLIYDYEPTYYYNIDTSWMDGNRSIEIIDEKILETGHIQYDIFVEGTQTLYFDNFMYTTNNLTEKINDSCSVSVNNQLIQEKYPSKRNNGILKLGTFTDEEVIVDVKIREDIYAKSFGVTGIDEKILADGLSRVKTADLNLSGKTISGTAKATDQGQYLLLSLPYDKGYTAFVNGKETEISRVLDAFMAIKLEQGSNTITLSYQTEGLMEGLIISGFGCLLVLLLILFRKDFYDRLMFLAKPLRSVFLVLSAGVLVAIYIFPILVYYLL